MLVALATILCLYYPFYTMEVHVNAMKNAHQIREYEERKCQERRRNLLYLIAQYLKDECYFESASTLSNEAHLTSQYQVCDNIDLGSILQDYESYYYVRFQKYPKICKRGSGEEGSFINLSKKVQQKITTKKTESNPQTDMKLAIKAKVRDNDDYGIMVSSVKCQISNEHDPKPRKRLKPLQGLKHGTEWLEMAETISKEIFLDSLDVHWDDIKGLEEPKRLLKEAVVYPVKYPDLFQGVLAPWRGLLLFGPPGTGKTLLAKAVATESSTTFFNISASSLVSKWRGDSEKLIRVLFDLARYHAPSTIFLDEVEALASCRESMEHEASRRMKTELLIQLDGIAQSSDEVFLLATSNLPWDLDPALLRRLEKRILVDLPNIQAREKMLEHYLPPILNTKPPIKCDVFYSFLAEEMEGYSGSDIRLVCKEAAMQAVRGIFEVLESSTTQVSCVVRNITTHDVQAALDKTRPSAAHFGERYKTWQQQFGSL